MRRLLVAAVVLGNYIELCTVCGKNILDNRIQRTRPEDVPIQVEIPASASLENTMHATIVDNQVSIVGQVTGPICFRRRSSVKFGLCYQR